MGKLHLIEIGHHELFVGLGGGFHEGFTELLGLGLEVGGNGNFLLVLAVEHLGGHIDKINVTYEGALLNDGELNGSDGNAELFGNGFHGLFEVGVFLVHLVDDEHAGHLGLLAHGHGLFGANDGTGNGAAENDGGIGKGHSLVNFAVEIEEAGGVDQIDLGVLPLKGSKSSRNGNMPLGLFGVIVGGGGAILNAAHTIEQAGVVEHSLSEGGLAFAAVTEDTDVANAVSFVVLHNSVISP